MEKITTIILTHNEEKNIRKCIMSAKDVSDEIIIIDSFSSDDTVLIAYEYGVIVHTRKFKNQADQFNWALDNVDIKGDWILRLDADEYLTPELSSEVKSVMNSPLEDVTGYYIKRRVIFMGRWIRYGGYYPLWFLRLWRRGCARIQDREMDEHTLLNDGNSCKLKNDFVDENHNGLTRWIDKHNNYSTREAYARMREKNLKQNGESASARVKMGIYSRSPLFIRSFLYFVYRYIFLFGFLDGREGLIFHTLQGFWHQFTIDAKLYEMECEKREGV